MGFDPEKITFFAKTDARGQQVPFGIKAKDRQRHMYVVGKTGMGKSTLLENMAVQDIKNGEGMAFIDPHGSAAETLLEYIPENRINDVIYFAPFDLNNPISFNVMEDVGPDKRHLVVSGLMSTFKKIWVDAWSARMEYILTNALLALIEYPDTTLLSVNRLFTDKNYRNQVVNYIKDPAVKAFWTDEFASYTDRFIADALPAIQNKIGQFTGNPLIRNIIGQPHSSFDLRKVMDEKKILIMNLSKGLIGETNANLLGSMLTTRIYLAAMSRADLAVEEMRQMPNFYFYVDEFQSFANATFANILSEARKYHLNLIIAHQYIEQMEEEVKNAVFGNVGTTISFRVGPFDAEVLETVFAPQFAAADLVNLGFAQIYLTLMIDGIGSQPFSAITLPPIERPRVSFKTVAINSSRRNFTKPREEVEKAVIELHMPAKVENKNDGQRKPNNNQAGATNQNQNRNQNQTQNNNQNFNSKFKKDNFKTGEENNFGKKVEPNNFGEKNFNLEKNNFNREKESEKITFSKKNEEDFLSNKNLQTEKVPKKENKWETDPKKSLSDLRNILVKITKENEEEKIGVGAEKDISGEKNNFTNQDKAQSFKNNNFKKPETKPDTKSELRSLLAGLKQEESEVIPEKKAEKFFAEFSDKKFSGVEKKEDRKKFFSGQVSEKPKQIFDKFQLEQEREKIRKEESEKIRKEMEEKYRLKKLAEDEEREREKIEQERKIEKQKEREEMVVLSEEIESFFLELEKWSGNKNQNQTQNNYQNQSLKDAGEDYKIHTSDKKQIIEFTPQSIKVGQNNQNNYNKNFENDYQNFFSPETKKDLKSQED